MSRAATVAGNKTAAGVAKVTYQMTRARISAAIVAALFTACGGESPTTPSPPTAPSVSSTPSPPAAIQDGLTLELGTSSARFVIDRGGGPGQIWYSFSCQIRVPIVFYETDMTIQHVEHWVTDADGTVYINAVADSYTGKKMGRSSRIVGTGCGDPLFHDANSARPTASTYRVRLEYTFDDPGSPAGVRVVTAEGAVESRVPPRPLMTSLTMTSDLTGQRPQWDGRRPMTFTATEEEAPLRISSSGDTGTTSCCVIGAPIGPLYGTAPSPARRIPPVPLT